MNILLARTPHAGFSLPRIYPRRKKGKPLAVACLYCLSVARAAATTATAALTMPATAVTTAAATRWHEHPAARQGRQQRDYNSRLG